MSNENRRKISAQQQFNKACVKNIEHQAAIQTK